MKKILVTAVSVVAGVALAHAQGILELNSGTVFNITTNTGTFGNPSVPNANAGYSSIVSGKTLTSGSAPFGFDYTYLFISSGSLASISDSNNLASSDWVQLAQDNSGVVGAAMLGTNVAVAGNFGGQSGTAGQSLIGIGGQAFNSGTTYQIAMVGWSSNLGSWSQVLGQYQTGWTSIGDFGYVIASVNPASGGVGNAPTAIFGNGSLVLDSVAPTGVPEPATMALAGLGGLSMLFLLRRKA